jgi:succinate-semialdehyde dehydrogenase / glutarate-semialdehyde dehydrogenase
MKTLQREKNNDLKNSFALDKLKSMDPSNLPVTTILTGLKPGIAAYHEELYGSVASFYVVKDEQAAIDLANDPDFCSGSSIFIKGVKPGKELADQIDTETVFIHHPTIEQADQPDDGTKGSGFGRELSVWGILEFVNKKLIRISELNNLF